MSTRMTSFDDGSFHDVTRPARRPAASGRCATTGLAVLLALVLSAAGCTTEHSHAEGEHEHGEETWSVTAWGDRYEIFPEVGLLAVGETAVSHTHVTILDGFAPLEDGTVAIVLRGEGGAEQEFRSAGPSRPGIFPVEIRPEREGDFGLLFRIASPAGSEDIPGGRVRVGSHETPGGLVEAPRPEAPSARGEALTFLKEEQWRSEFATAWVETGTLERSADGVARVRPASGGEAAITSPVDAVLRSEPWPYPGMRVREGEPIFRLVPRIAADRSLAALAGDVEALEAELDAARARRRRLAELLQVDATSERELEEATARVESLTARYEAALRDLEGSRSARQGGGEGAASLSAPFAGEIASVSASPGEAVSAGALLARLVRTDPVWLEVAVSPEGARQVGRAGVVGVVASFPEGPPLRLEAGVRLVAVAPEVSPATGTVAVLLEVPAHEELILGTTVGAQILLAESTEGIVVPASAVIDDGGVPVVYLQLTGESFARQELHVVARQGDRVLVGHLEPGQRLVTRGGEAIRRSSLMASGDAQGHVH